MSSILKAAQFWTPAVVEEKVKNAAWKIKTPDNTTISLRAGVAFLTALPSTFYAFGKMSIGNNSWISSDASLKISQVSSQINLFAAQNPHLPSAPVIRILTHFVDVALFSPKFFFAFVSASIIALFIAWREAERAQKAIDLSNKTQFTTGNFVDDKFMSYLAKNPSAIEALIHSSLDDVLNRTVDNKRGVFGYVFSDHRLSKDYYKIFRLITDHFTQNNAKVSKEAFYQTLLQEDPYFANYLLSKNLFKVSDFNPDEIIECWKHVNNDQLAGLLAENKFDINQKDLNNNSPLLEALKGLCDPTKVDVIPRNAILRGKVYLLLKHGAYFQDETELNSSLTFRVNGVDTTKPLKKWLEPKILQALKQAKKNHEKNTTLPSFKRRFFELWKPAVTLSPILFQIDDGAIFLRTTAIGVITATIALATLFKATPLKTLIGIAILTPLVSKWCWDREWNKATKALNNFVVDLFINSRFHSHEVSKYIGSHPDMILELLREKADLTQQDDNRETLWKTLIEDAQSKSQELTTSAFILLATEVFKNLLPDEKFQHLLSVLKMKDPKYVNALSLPALTNLKLPPKPLIDLSTLTPQQRFECYLACGSRETIKWLSGKGFDPNATNDTGFTPVLYAAFAHASSFLPRGEFIRAMIEETSADPAKTVLIGSERKGLKDFLTNPSIPTLHQELIGFIEKTIDDRSKK